MTIRLCLKYDDVLIKSCSINGEPKTIFMEIQTIHQIKLLMETHSIKLGPMLNCSKIVITYKSQLQNMCTFVKETSAGQV